MKRTLIIIAMALTAVTTAAAQEKPTGDEARKVIDYYYQGKGGGAVLMDLQICEGIGKEEGGQKNECLNTIEPGKVQLGQELQLWMNFLVPIDDTADIIVTFSRKGKVRHTANVKLTSANRYRTWKRLPTERAGQWTISILQELADKDLDLGSLQYTVAGNTP